MPNHVWLRGEGAILDLDFVPLMYIHADNVEIFLSLNQDASGQIPRMVITERDDRASVINAYMGPNHVWLRSEGAIIDLDFVPLTYIHADDVEIFLSLNHDANGQIPRLVITEPDDRSRVINAYMGVSNDDDTTVTVRRAKTHRPGRTATTRPDIQPGEARAPTPIRRNIE